MFRSFKCLQYNLIINADYCKYDNFFNKFYCLWRVSTILQSSGLKPVEIMLLASMKTTTTSNSNILEHLWRRHFKCIYCPHEEMFLPRWLMIARSIGYWQTHCVPKSMSSAGMVAWFRTGVVTTCEVLCPSPSEAASLTATQVGRLPLLPHLPCLIQIFSFQLATPAIIRSKNHTLIPLLLPLLFNQINET